MQIGSDEAGRVASPGRRKDENVKHAAELRRKLQSATALHRAPHSGLSRSDDQPGHRRLFSAQGDGEALR